MLWRSVFLLSCFVVLGTIAPAKAHPHVFVEVHSVYLFDEKGQLNAVREVWSFDSFFSTMLVEEFDKDQSGSFDAEEIADLKRDAFDSTAEFNYFTHILVDGALRPVSGIDHFEAKLIGDSLVYVFTVQLDAPVDPRRHRLTLGLYDPSFYVDVALAEGEANRAEQMPSGCSFVMEEDSLNPIYYGMVYPYVTRIACAAG